MKNALVANSRRLLSYQEALQTIVPSLLTIFNMKWMSYRQDCCESDAIHSSISARNAASGVGCTYRIAWPVDSTGRRSL